MTSPGADLVAQVAEAVRAGQLDAVAELGREAVLWLAAPPLWTRPAAEAAGFPSPAVTDFVRRAADEGWCETRGSLRGDGAAGLAFWMPQDVRRDVLDLLSQGGSRQGLAAAARQVAERVDQRVLSPATGPGAEAEVPDALRYWAQLMLQPDPGPALVDRVTQAVDAQDLVAAQQLVAAGEALAQLLAGTMELAADRARRLYSLGSRRRQDARALERYLDRLELSGAVGGLLRGDTARWALHLRGMGGVGKTMLVRYLASGRYATERDEPPLTIARVDFDHMSPDYPVRRPVQLLLELADELALHTAAAGQADQALARFRQLATSVHESLSSVREERAAPLRNPSVLAAIDTFADTLRLLPRPLLILDTCEELAKANAGDPAAPAVTNTLAIIERIHDQAPDARVLLAGRRPLPERDYLAVTPVAGFTTDEATRYLNGFAARPLPGDLVRAIIRQSPAVDADVPAPGRQPGRVSPFDLALYREWAEDDPDLDVRRVERGSHAYVEGRIIARLDDQGVRRALPVLATAGRCRVTTIATFLDADPAQLGPRLAEQEWTEAVGDPPTHVSAGPALALRLRNYYAEPERSATFAAATARLAAMLSRQVRDVPLADVDGDELLAALRLSEPADAARLWDEVAARAAAEGRWTWLFNITRWVSGEAAEKDWPTAGALRGGVLAATIAASRRALPGFNPAATWAEVRRGAGDHPDPEAARCLRARAVLGSLPYAPDDEELWGALEDGFGRYESAERMADVGAAVADAAHRLLEAGAMAAARRLLLRAGQEWPAASLPVPASAAPGQSARERFRPDVAPPWSGYPQLRAWLLVAFGRLLADEEPPLARRALEIAAVVTEAQVPLAGGPRPWADVILPDDQLARIRIEQGLITHTGDDDSLDWNVHKFDLLPDHAPDPGQFATIDGERLASLCLLSQLRSSVVDRSAVTHWAEADRYVPGRVATSSAHDLVPPLFAAVAEAWLAAGDPRQALEHVARHRQAALATRDDEATVRHADAVTVRIARRLRLDDQLALLSRLASVDDLLLSGASSPDDAGPARLALLDDARRAIAVIRNTPPERVDAEVSSRPAGWHAWWQCQAPPVGQVPAPYWSAGEDPALAADIEVDLHELGRLAKARAQQLLADQGFADWIARPRPAPLARSAQPYRRLRPELRQAALDEAGRQEDAFRRGEPVTWGAPLPPGVPPRLLAEMAFDEAELLALRFPLAAVLLFEAAAAAYRSAQDGLGRVLAELARVETALAARGAASTIYQPAMDRFEDLTAETPPPADLSFFIEAGSPWRHWAKVLAGLPWNEDTSPAAHPPARRPRYTEGLRALRSRLPLYGWLALAVAGAGLAEFAVIAAWVLIATLPGLIPLIVAGLVAATVTAAAVAARRWRQRALCRLLDGTPIGTAIPLSSLTFSVVVRPVTQVSDCPFTLWGFPRFPWPLPGQRARLLATALAMGLVSGSRLGREHRRTGYEGRVTASDGDLAGTVLSWTSSAAPEADARWWSEGTAEGRIVTHPADAARPWERIITGGLGPHAAGRIQWRRQVFVSTTADVRFSVGLAAADAPAPRAAYGVRLDAPSSWETIFADHYPASGTDDPGQPGPVRHAIGASVTTSAGPRLEVSPPSAGGAPRLLGPDELLAGGPPLIIIQAQPAAAESSTLSHAPAGAADELARRQAAAELQGQLALAVDLIRSGAVPAVLLLPALPEARVAETAQAIARYAAAGGRSTPTSLHADLRGLLRPAVAPEVLDDIVLFLNDRG